MKHPTPLRALMLIAILAVFLMSFVPVLIRWTTANEATIGIVRLSIAFIGLLLFTKVRHQLKALKKRDWLWFPLLGLVFGVHWYLYFRSIKLAGASLAAIGVATFGIHLLLLNGIFNRKLLRKTDWLAVGLSFTGMLIASPSLDLTSTTTYGFVLAILSGFLYACLPMINQQLLNVSTQMRALGQFGFALLVFLPLAPQSSFDLLFSDWMSLITLGVVCTLVAHTLWIKSSSELPAQFTAVIYYGYVPLAMVMSYFVLNEDISVMRIIGAVLIISANILAVLLHHHRRPHETD